MNRIFMMAVACVPYGCTVQEGSPIQPTGATRLNTLSGASADGVDEAGEEQPSEEQLLSPEELASKENPTYPDELWHQVVALYAEYNVDRWADLPRQGLEAFEGLIGPWRNEAGMDTELVAADHAHRVAFEAAVIDQELDAPQEIEELKNAMVGEPGSTTYVGLPVSEATP